ncbi:hypothetical protein Tco_0737290 [Tanacetum coccineum]
MNALDSTSKIRSLGVLGLDSHGQSRRREKIHELDQFYAKDLWKANYSTSLMGKVKEFSSLTNLKVVLDNEGKVLCVRAKEIFGWIPDFVEDDEGESDSDDEIRDEGLHDENVDKHKYATVEGEK